MTPEQKIIAELKRRLDAQTNCIEAIYKQLTDIYRKLEAIDHAQTDRRRADLSH